jgi:hypothetical protein
MFRVLAKIVFRPGFPAARVSWNICVNCVPAQVSLFKEIKEIGNESNI